MNLRKKMRRSSLAALIALALSSSTLAMPTGGVVQSGDVNIGGRHGQLRHARSCDNQRYDASAWWVSLVRDHGRYSEHPELEHPHGKDAERLGDLLP
ncbi:hypothetical protein [uncultured Selenomonas sp.]|uniref:hypothetical protein n=1 Tax=uncultured Selenomonas sp. TaxID=159275 RepID=UPI0028EBF45E|nr:hypothetical protein [uncultured Selenomonas sp.]